MPYIENLRECRLSLGLSQTRLAGKAEVDRMTVSRCENGYFVQDTSCTKIAGALEKAGCTRPIIIVDGGTMGEMPKKGGRPAAE